MPKPSYMMRRMQAEERLRHDMRLDREILDLGQLYLDAAFMAANDVFHMGPGRCKAFGDAMIKYINEMAAMRVQDKKSDPQYVYTREKVDARLKQICGEHFDPLEVCYGEKKESR